MNKNPSSATTSALTRNFLAGAVMAAVVTPSALAQGLLEEIIVTATKRSESVQDIPASVTAFSADKIDLTEITNNRDLQFSVPGLVAGYANGSSLLTLRGIGSNSTTGVDDPAVAQHIDGVYQTRTQTIALALNDLERVEVLKGPQGTLYGRNSTGGAINYVTNKPTDEFEGSVSLTAGNDGRLGMHVMLSGSLTDTVSARGNLYYNEQDGSLEVVGGDSPDFLGEETLGGRLALRITPTHDLTIDLDASTIENETLAGSQILAVVDPVAAGYLLPGTFTTEPNKLVSDANPDGEITQDAFSATVDWNINGEWSLKSITGYMENDYALVGYDVDFSTSPFFQATGTTESESDSLSQELNLNYTGGGINFVAGLFYLDDSFSQKQAFPEFFLVLNFDQESEAWAVFADVTVDVTNEFRVLGGIRYNEEEKEVVQGGSCGLEGGKEEWSSTNPKIGFQYDVGGDSMVYGTWQEGFKAGGFDPAGCASSYNPEEIEAIEIGLKSTLFDGAGLLNIAFFDYDYTDLQVQQLEGLVTLIQNAGEARVQGVDVEFQYAISNSLSMELSGSYLDTEVDDLFLNDPFAAPGSPAVDVSGKTLRRAPEFSGTFALTYNVNFGDGSELQLRGEVYYSDDVRYRFFDDEPAAFQESYTTGNLYANLSLSAVEGLSFRTYVKNVSDEEVLQGVIPFSQGGSQLGSYTRGRTFGLEAKYDF